MGRCEYRHDAFRHTDVYRGDQTDQCRVPETGIFGTDEAPKQYCVFHAPEDKEPVDRDDWPIEGRGELQVKALKALLDEWNNENENKRRSNMNEKPLAFVLPGLQCGGIDLAGYVFSETVCFDEATFSGDALFNKATFSGSAVFSKATFSRTLSATFRKDAFFDEATFTRHAFFDEATFRGVASFKQVTFSKVASFQGTTFSGDALFHMATFSGVASFKEVTFRGDFTFHRGRLDNPVTLIKCAITTFHYKLPAGEALIFNQCDAPEGIDRSTVRWNFTDQDCSRLVFLNTPLNQAIFLGADVRETRFDSCTWDHPADSRYAKVFGHNEDADQDKLRLLQSLYSQLNKNMEANRDYRLAGDFHYREMEIRQRLLAGTGLSAERMVLWLYGLVADFGENWVKIFEYLVLSFLGTGFAISSVEVRDSEGALLIGKIFFEYPYYAKVAVLGIVPSGFQRQLLLDADLTSVSMFFIALQVIVSLILTTLFVMALRRRFKR